MFSGEENRPIQDELDIINLSSLCDDQASVVQPKLTMLGNVGEFDGSEEMWSSYVERFELFCDCNKVDDGKKVSMLLTVVGVKT